MDFADALQIVIDLARSAMADTDEPEAFAQHNDALNIVEDYAVNHEGND